MVYLSAKWDKAADLPLALHRAGVSASRYGACAVRVATKPCVTFEKTCQLLQPTFPTHLLRAQPFAGRYRRGSPSPALLGLTVQGWILSSLSQFLKLSLDGAPDRLSREGALTVLLRKLKACCVFSTVRLQTHTHTSFVVVMQRALPSRGLKNLV